MSLFTRGPVRLHSGEMSEWKIDCDALTDEDIETLALIASERVGSFGQAVGIPRGGLRLARAMEQYKSPTGPVLIVDDVLTTGASMWAANAEFGPTAIGLVIFARGVCPSWVTPIFEMRVAGPRLAQQ